MAQTKPYVRQLGSGQPILCLHSSASSSKQWLPLMESGKDMFHFIAPDLLGYGRSPLPDNSDSFSLDDELSLLEPIIAHIAKPFHIVAHSYGGAVGLALARRSPRLVKSITVYEPVLFGLLKSDSSSQDTFDEIATFSRKVAEACGNDGNRDAARLFIDYWTGGHAWDNLGERDQDSIRLRMTKVLLDFQAVLFDTTPLASYADISVPVLLLSGTASPRPTRSIIEILATTIPHNSLKQLQGTGHMAPITDPQRVNDLIIDYLTARTDFSTKAVPCPKPRFAQS
jgi:pimeloyl-ACP methyl ester carboxylesterase